MNEMLPQARKEKRAIGAFNVANYETALAILKAAEGRASVRRYYDPAPRSLDKVLERWSAAESVPGFPS